MPAGRSARWPATGVAGFSGDGGAATLAQLSDPWGVALDAAGNLYIADRINHRIRKVDASGTISTVAGNGTAGFSGDGGDATLAQLSDPRGVALDAAGNLYIADLSNNRIRKVDASGTISTVAGNGTRVLGRWGRGDAGAAEQSQRGAGCGGQPVHRGFWQPAHPQGGCQRDDQHGGRQRVVRVLGRWR
jgi:hypothetical protein